MTAGVEVIVTLVSQILKEVVIRVTSNSSRLASVKLPAALIALRSASVEAILAVLLMAVTANVVHGLKELSVKEGMIQDNRLN